MSAVPLTLSFEQIVFWGGIQGTEINISKNTTHKVNLNNQCQTA